MYKIMYPCKSCKSWTCPVGGSKSTRAVSSAPLEEEGDSKDS